MVAREELTDGNDDEEESDIVVSVSSSSRIPLSRKKRASGEDAAKGASASANSGGGGNADLFSGQNEKHFVLEDLRQSGCLGGIRNEEGCHVSYIFATIAMYEYEYCNWRGRISFSELYPIDCGHRSGLSGCQDGDLSILISFIRTFGLETRNEYPYLRQHYECRYKDGANFRYIGEFKTKTDYGMIGIDNFDSYISQTRPIIFKLKVHHNFNEYGGGVDEVEICDGKDGFVTMLLVGSGREDGKDYWLFRNSRGESWGEGGYYKMSYNSRRCVADEGGLVLGTNGFDYNQWHVSLVDEENKLRRRGVDVDGEGRVLPFIINPNRKQLKMQQQYQ